MTEPPTQALEPEEAPPLGLGPELLAEAERLSHRLPHDPDWDLFVTILWIGSRDFAWMAPRIVAAQTVLRQTFDAVSAGGLVDWANECLRQLPEKTRHSLDPEGQLRQKLRGDKVRAMGLRGAGGEPDLIPPEQWLYLHFPATGPKEHDGLSCAYSGDPMDPQTHFWSRLAFDSASVMRAFPQPDLGLAWIVPSARPTADDVCNSPRWQDRDAWPPKKGWPEGHFLHVHGEPRRTFIGWAIDERLVEFAPAGLTGSEARLWAGELIAKMARAGKLRTDFDRPSGGRRSWFAATGSPDRDRDLMFSTLKELGEPLPGGGWRPLHLYNVDLKRILGELMSRRNVDARLRQLDDLARPRSESQGPNADQRGSLADAARLTNERPAGLPPTFGQLPETEASSSRGDGSLDATPVAGKTTNHDGYRLADAEAIRRFDAWYGESLTRGRPPTRTEAVTYAQTLGRSREWARARLRERPREQRNPIGGRRR